MKNIRHILYNNFFWEINILLGKHWNCSDGSLKLITKIGNPSRTPKNSNPWIMRFPPGWVGGENVLQKTIWPFFMRTTFWGKQSLTSKPVYSKILFRVVFTNRLKKLAGSSKVRFLIMYSSSASVNPISSISSPSARFLVGSMCLACSAQRFLKRNEYYKFHQQNDSIVDSQYII